MFKTISIQIFGDDEYIFKIYGVINDILDGYDNVEIDIE